MTLNLTLNESKNAFINDSSVEEYEYEYDYDYDESIATFDWSELGPSLFVFGITFIIGILGNCLILVAVIRHTHVKNSPVNVFLASLASADLLLILICLPLKVAKLFSFSWEMGAFSCKLLYYMQSVSGICSVLNLTALSIERYYVIVHPLKAQYLCTMSKAKKTVVITWILAFLLAIPIIVVQIHMEVGFRRKAYWCVRDFDSRLWWQLQELYFLLIILVVPALIMGFSYIKIIFEVFRVVKQRINMTGYAQGRKDTQVTEVPVTDIEMKSFIEDGSALKNDALDNLEGNEIQQPKLDSETKQVVRMLISIVLTFIICWAPLLIFNVLHAFAVVAPDGWVNGTNKHLKSIFSLLAYCNSCLNPIIYGFMSRSFRKSFVSELKLCCCGNGSCCCCCAGSNNYHENNSSAKEKFRENQGNCSVQFNGGGGGVRGGSISVMATRGESTTRGRNKSTSINSFKGGYSRNDQGRTPFQTVTDDGNVSTTEISVITSNTNTGVPKMSEKQA